MSLLNDILTTVSQNDLKFASVIGLIGLFMILMIVREIRKKPAPAPSAAEAAPAPAAAQTRGPKNNIVEIVIMMDGFNQHEKIRTAELAFTHGVYEVSETSLYKKNLGIFERLRYLLTGIKNHYIILFWDDEPEPVTLPENEVNPQILARVKTSRVLSKAFKEMFKTSILDNRGLIFIIIVFAAIALFILRAQGYLGG